MGLRAEEGEGWGRVGAEPQTTGQPAVGAPEQTACKRRPIGGAAMVQLHNPLSSVIGWGQLGESVPWG